MDENQNLISFELVKQNTLSEFYEVLPTTVKKKKKKDELPKMLGPFLSAPR